MNTCLEKKTMYIKNSNVIMGAKHRCQSCFATFKPARLPLLVYCPRGPAMGGNLSLSTADKHCASRTYSIYSIATTSQHKWRCS